MRNILATLCGMLVMGSAFPAKAELVCNDKTRLVNVLADPRDDLEPKSDADVAMLRQLKKGATEPLDIVDTLTQGSRVKVIGPSQKDSRWVQIVFRHSKTGILSQGFVHRTRIENTACTPPVNANGWIEDKEYFARSPDEPRLNVLDK
jgi:uncharacterized protein YgiM (DUF1202 family)